jgi:hypothetical protein
VCVAPLQIGVTPEQSASATHVTQVPVAVAHTGVAPVHWLTFEAEHSPHDPDAWQAGATPPHSPSPAQARQVCVVGSQIGVAPAHCADVRHPTQAPATTLQAGVAPEHCVAFVTEHVPHDPFGWQAGFAPPQSLSATQARHVCVPVSQAGVVPEQLALATHATHVAVAASQAGVAPEHCVAFVAEHVPHDPPA